MIKSYIDKINERSTHERRAHAMRVATGVTAFAFLIWLSTLGVRFASHSAPGTQGNDQVASVAAAQDGSNATLIVATTTDSNSYFNR